MSITYGLFGPPGAPGSAVDDLFVARATGEQWRWDGSDWDKITARADVVPGAGLTDEHLAKIGGEPYRTGWVEAAQGMVWDSGATFAGVPSDEWVCNHGLRYLHVAVQIVNNAGVTVLADIEYSTPLACVIRFANPVAGVAVIRR